MKTIPKEFETFGLWLNQDAQYLFGPTVEDMFDGAIRAVPRANRPALLEFVNRVLESGYSHNEITRIFRMCDSDWGPRDETSAYHMFVLMKQTLIAFERDKDNAGYDGPRFRDEQ